MPECSTTGIGPYRYDNDGYSPDTRSRLRLYGYAPECGNSECATCTLRNDDGYSYEGFDRDGYDGDGYDANGFNRSGNNRCAAGECDCYDHESESDSRRRWRMEVQRR